jgi:hypothetical protein
MSSPYQHLCISRDRTGTIFIMSIRLINTTTLELEVFMGDDLPPYAILSHTWIGKEETSLQEYVTLLDNKEHASRQKTGFKKIEQTCARALEDLYGWVWIDTCCIDKTSSAELNEAINSMFKWYQEAGICYAYLSDLPAGADLDACLPKCRWFFRGWCLQELLAPTDLLFLDTAWTTVGSRSGLRKIISQITRIDEDVVVDSKRMYDLPIARRMSWAATRSTTRVEDQAYCLLGIFDVNMPMLYGEGEKEFFRLQEEIIKRSNDLSIFHNSSTIDESQSDRFNRTSVYARCDYQSLRDVHWLPRTVTHGTRDRLYSESETEGDELERMSVSRRWPYRNLFAKSPRAFLHSHVFNKRYHSSFSPDGKPRAAQYGIHEMLEFRLSQNGLRITVSVGEVTYKSSSKKYSGPCYIVDLGCSRKTAEKLDEVGYMLLRKVGSNIFVRLGHPWLSLGRSLAVKRTTDWGPRSITILPIIDKPSTITALNTCDYYAIRFIFTDVKGEQVNMAQHVDPVVSFPEGLWDSWSSQFLTHGLHFQGSLYVGCNLLCESAKLRSIGFRVICVASCGVVESFINRLGIHVALCTESTWQEHILVRHPADRWGSTTRYGSTEGTLLSDMAKLKNGVGYVDAKSRRFAALSLDKLRLEARAEDATGQSTFPNGHPEYTVTISCRYEDNTAGAEADVSKERSASAT